MPSPAEIHLAIRQHRGVDPIMMSANLHVRSFLSLAPAEQRQVLLQYADQCANWIPRYTKTDWSGRMIWDLGKVDLISFAEGRQSTLFPLTYIGFIKWNSDSRIFQPVYGQPEPDTGPMGMGPWMDSRAVPFIKEMIRDGLFDWPKRGVTILRDLPGPVEVKSRIDGRPYEVIDRLNKDITDFKAMDSRQQDSVLREFLKGALRWSNANPVQEKLPWIHLALENDPAKLDWIALSKGAPLPYDAAGIEDFVAYSPNDGFRVIKQTPLYLPTPVSSMFTRLTAKSFAGVMKQVNQGYFDLHE